MDMKVGDIIQITSRFVGSTLYKEPNEYAVFFDALTPPGTIAEVVALDIISTHKQKMMWLWFPIQQGYRHTNRGFVDLKNNWFKKISK